MTLFHNADIADLNSIVSKGILPASITGNDNWTSNKRADNSRSVVYLFDPTGRQNSFVHYGAALIEVEADAQRSELVEGDQNKGYDEYTCAAVAPENIRKIYIPEIFRNRISGLSEETLEKVEWVKIEADVYDHYEPNPDDIFGFGGKSVYAAATSEQIALIGESADIYVNDDSYLRTYDPGINDMIDLYNVVYVK